MTARSVARDQSDGPETCQYRSVQLPIRHLRKRSPMFHLSPRTNALVAGLAYVVMTASAFLAVFDPAAFAALPDGTGLWPDSLTGPLRTYLVGQIVIVVMDVVIALALFALFRPAAPRLSLAMAATRLLYAAGFAFAITDLARAYTLTRILPADASGVAAVEAAFASYRLIWDVAFFLFAAHLVLLGALVWGESTLRKVLGVLLVVAGLGYFADSVIALALPEVAFRFAIYTFVGEMTLMLWLLFAAGRSGRQVRAA